MIHGMRICSYLWLAFFALWIVAGLRTKRAVERVDWANRIYYNIPVVLGMYLMFRFDTTWTGCSIGSSQKRKPSS
jgi:hypothetical protein